MTEKEISIKLTRNATSNIVLRFYIYERDYDLNLESNNSESIKTIFVELSKALRKSPIKIKYEIDKESINEKEDGLFVDSSAEYIKQLESELLTIENDSDLKILREKKEG